MSVALYVSSTLGPVNATKIKFVVKHARTFGTEAKRKRTVNTPRARQSKFLLNEYLNSLNTEKDRARLQTTTKVYEYPLKHYVDN